MGKSISQPARGAGGFAGGPRRWRLVSDLVADLGHLGRAPVLETSQRLGPSHMSDAWARDSMSTWRQYRHGRHRLRRPPPDRLRAGARWDLRGLSMAPRQRPCGPNALTGILVQLNRPGKEVGRSAAGFPNPTNLEYMEIARLEPLTYTNVHVRVC